MKRRTYPPTGLSSQQLYRVRKFAKAHGYGGMSGGWIYHKSGRIVAHGWAMFYEVIGGTTIEKWFEKQKAMKKKKEVT